MGFLQPIALIALPLIGVPILIHLVNQHRHRTLPWAAMMFLMSAKRLSKGIARLRQLLILALRVLAVGTLIFVVSRPLSGGWLGSISMRPPDATLILLDRSASMETQDLQAGQSKRTAALQKLTHSLEIGDSGTHLVLIESTSTQHQEIASPKALVAHPRTDASATAADIPGMLETALAYLKANQTGRVDVWICSDLSENDWDVESGRWQAIREEFAKLEGVHHFLLASTDTPSHNLSIRVENVHRWQHGTPATAELVLDVVVRSKGGTPPPKTQIAFEVNKVHSVVDLHLDRHGATLKGHRIPIDTHLKSGWGSVALPGDANQGDNRFYFVFSEPAIQRAVVVTDDVPSGEAFRRALAIPIDPQHHHQVDVIPADRVDTLDWEQTGLLIWQAALPRGPVAAQIENFVDTGRVVLFFPPTQNTRERLFDTRWGDWTPLEDAENRVSWWRGDTDLFAHVQSGAPLPLNELRTYRYRAVESPGTPLARFEDDAPLLTRVATDQGAVYFCSTLPTAQFSSLDREGIIFYVMLQRAFAEGCRALAVASHRDAAPDALADRNTWEFVAPVDTPPLMSQRGQHAGVYREGRYWTAVNRSLMEDTAAAVPVETIDALFEGLSYRRIDAEVGDTSALASELWHIFLIAMIGALLVEAWLSLPKRPSVA